MKGRSRVPFGSEAGTGLVLAILILAALSILGTSIAIVAMSDRNVSRYERDSVEALAAAETGVAFAKSRIIHKTAPMEDYDHDGRPDFVLADTLEWGGSYRVIAEASDIISLDVPAYFSNGFTIVSEGRYRGSTRRVRVQIVHDSFYRFARFVYDGNVHFNCNDEMGAEVYAGGDLTMKCGCTAGQEPRFLEKVSVAGSVASPGCGDFYKGYEEGVDPIDLPGSLSWDIIRDKVHGTGSDNACEGRGVVGIYENLPGTDPLNLHTQAAPDLDVLVFDRFDFMNLTIAPPDTVITYGGAPVMNTLTGQPLRRGDFNGIVMFEGDAKVRGSLDGVSAYRVSVFGSGNVLIENDVIAGHTGFDPITRLPNNSGNPVTTSLVAEGYVAMDDGSPRVLRIDAALFAHTANWKAIGGPGQHPPVLTGPLDLDLDGIWGETPHNNDPTPGEGWDEANPTEKFWVLNMRGPIITATQGDANPWTSDPVLGEASGLTFRYEYDQDYMTFPPPCFPFPINVWHDVSWTEVFEVRNPLADYLPN